MADLRLTVAVFANKKLLPAFERLQQEQPVDILFSDWSLSISRLTRSLRNIIRADLVYFHSPSNLRILLLPVAKLLLKPTMLQWIGGDVLIATNKASNTFYDIGKDNYIPVRCYTLNGLSGFQRLIVSAAFRFHVLFNGILKLFVDHHVACAPHLSRELSGVGIQAEYLPLINSINPELLPFPSELAVLSYIGYFDASETRDYYGWQTILRLANDFPKLTIYTIGRGWALGKLPKNIIHLGFIDDIKQVLAQVRAVLRISYYDGTPRLVLEGLSTGRYVAYTKPFPHCVHIKKYADVAQFIKELADKEIVNIEGLQYAESEYAHTNTTANYMKQFNKCLGHNVNPSE